MLCARISWSMAKLVKLNVKYKEGTASDPAMLRPLLQANEMMPDVCTRLSSAPSHAVCVADAEW